MPTPDPRPTESAEGQPMEELIAGVSLDVYLTVEAARLDGLDEAAVLAWLGVRPTDFERAEERWRDRIDDALAGDDGFEAVYLAGIERALARWSREVDPLDRDVDAWIQYQRHGLAAGDGADVGARLGLTAGDEVRLGATWRSRLRDPAIATRAASAMDAPLRPLPTVRVAPLVFPPPCPGSATAGSPGGMRA